MRPNGLAVSCPASCWGARSNRPVEFMVTISESINGINIHRALRLISINHLNHFPRATPLAYLVQHFPQENYAPLKMCRNGTADQLVPEKR